MSEFLLRRENSPGLKKLVHIEGFALQKNNQIRVNSFNDTCPGCLRFYYVPDGKVDWVIKSDNDTVYLNDPAIVLTGQEVYAEKVYFETGSLYWLNRHLIIQHSKSTQSPGQWSDISPAEIYFYQEEIISFKIAGCRINPKEIEKIVTAIDQNFNPKQ